MDRAKAAQAIIDLINSKPSSPSVDEIAAVLRYEDGTHLVSPAGALLANVQQINTLAESVMRLATPLVINDFRISMAAFACFAQEVGPPMAYYEPSMTERYTYEAFAWQSRDIDKIVARVDDLVTQLKSLHVTKIVWRSKPELERTDDGIHRFYCRFHVLPYQSLQSLPGFKRECEMMAEA